MIPMYDGVEDIDDDDDTDAGDDDSDDDDDSAETVPGYPDWPEDGGGGDDPGAVLFDWSEIPEIHLELSDEAIEFLHEDFEAYNPWNPDQDPFEYTEAAVIYDGLRYEPVGVRLKGQNSARDIYDKAAFKIRFNWAVPGARFLGMKAITLNNMVADTSMMHERIAYRLHREMGNQASRTNHAALYLNGDFYGLYTLIDPVNDQLLERHFEDPTGPLYEGWDVDFRAQYIDQYQHEEGEDDRTMLWGLAEALEGEGPEAIAAAEEFLNYEQFRSWWAVGATIAYFDGYPYTTPGDDYHVYADPLTEQIHFLPWGLDECFSSYNWSVSNVSGIVASRCKDDPECREAWVTRVFETVTVAEEQGWDQWFLEVQEQIAPYVEMDTRKPYTNNQVSSAQNSMESVIDGRREQLESQLLP